MSRKKHGRRAVRLSEYDYRQPESYFITICSHKRRPLAGGVEEGRFVLSPIGRLVRTRLREIPHHYEHVELDEHVVMPNHLHMILFLHGRGTTCRAPTVEGHGKPVAGSLPTVIRSYKGAVTKRWRQLSGDRIANVWQRNNFESAIRGERELNQRRRHIRQNPHEWQLDRCYVA